MAATGGEVANKNVNKKKNSRKNFHQFVLLSGSFWSFRQMADCDSKGRRSTRTKYRSAKNVLATLPRSAWLIYACACVCILNLFRIFHGKFLLFPFPYHTNVRLWCCLFWVLLHLVGERESSLAHRSKRISSSENFRQTAHWVFFLSLAEFGATYLADQRFGLGSLTANEEKKRKRALICWQNKWNEKRFPPFHAIIKANAGAGGSKNETLKNKDTNTIHLPLLRKSFQISLRLRMESRDNRKILHNRNGWKSSSLIK